MSHKIPVAVLGATGAVGQRLVSLLADHPWFEIAALCASERSAGKSYGEACHWILSEDPPAAAAAITVRGIAPVAGIPIAFSALDATVAGDAEQAWAAAGALVSSNSRNHRMDADVPLLIPEINPDHLDLLAPQRAGRGWPTTGGIITNPNCSTIGITLALAPIHAAFGVTEVLATTMQATSGAGYPGVPALDILGNVIPFIPGEEEKIETEPLKIFGTLTGSTIAAAPIRISAMVNRVAVIDGHLAAVAFRTERAADLDAVRAAIDAFSGEPQRLRLPSAPTRPLLMLGARDRPQPARDALRGGGMTVTVGNLRPCPILGLKMTVLSHNTLRGAAGAALLNVEMLLARDGRADRFLTK